MSFAKGQKATIDPLTHYGDGFVCCITRHYIAVRSIFTVTIIHAFFILWKILGGLLGDTNSYGH